MCCLFLFFIEILICFNFCLNNILFFLRYKCFWDFEADLHNRFYIWIYNSKLNTWSILLLWFKQFSAQKEMRRILSVSFHYNKHLSIVSINAYFHVVASYKNVAVVLLFFQGHNLVNFRQRPHGNIKIWK
jgi:hypothetical protein